MTRILELKDVTVSFDAFRVLDDLNLGIEKGELRFLIGPNGAGKTTLLDVITGKVRPDRGQVIFNGQLDVSRQSDYRLVRAGIGRKFQTPSIFASLSVYENLEVAAGFGEPIAKLFRKLNPAKKDKVEEVLLKIGLQLKAQQSAGTLSHGEKQWLEIGMLLVQEPTLLLLDEPIAGMSRQERDKTGELVSALAGEHSVVVIEHDMQFVRQFASLVTVLHQGKVLCEGPVAEVQNDPRVIEVYLGRQHRQVA